MASFIPKKYRAIPELPSIPGEWIAWQIMGSRGPGRWSSRHYTTNGLRALCGKKIPHRYQMFRCDPDVVQDICPGCLRELGISEKSPKLENPSGRPLIDVLAEENE